jgi:hypothetical protein
MKMPQTTGEMIASSRRLPDLLRSMGEPQRSGEEAVADGIVERTKVSGRWLYFRSQLVLQAAKEEIQDAADEILAEWLLTPLPILANTIPRRMGRLAADGRAADLVLRILLRERQLRGLGLLTAEFEPYLAVYRAEDDTEIGSQIDAIVNAVSRAGSARLADLPVPSRARSSEAWRSTLLRHAEFLGLGGLRDGVLLA